jgi:hypothetical protein
VIFLLRGALQAAAASPLYGLFWQECFAHDPVENAGDWELFSSLIKLLI